MWTIGEYDDQVGNKVGPVEIYQYQKPDGSWIDQKKQSYDYNKRMGSATVRIVYTSLPECEPLSEEL
jgi:hypothetical protein